MAVQGQFVQDGHYVDYTPGADVEAGDVVVQGDLIGVAKGDIKANKLGALSVEGVFDFAKEAGGGVTFAVGAKAYWDDTNDVAVATDGGGDNKLLGKAVKAAADGDATVRVVLTNAGVLGNSVQGVAEGYRVARGVHTTVAASDTVVTGLTTVAAVCATLESNPGDDPLLVTASIGDQAGAPAAGSVLIKTWKTDGSDPTPAAATTFAKKVNWIAIGT